MTNYNALFLFFIGLIPFSTHLLGRYSYLHLAIVLYGLNIICIGISLFIMRRYIIHSDRIESVELSTKSNRHAIIRLFIPVICAALAMGLSFVNTLLSVSLFTFLIIFNLTPAGADVIDFLIGKFEKES